MSDMIKRQEAINELVRWGKIPGYSRGERNIIACTIAMLDSLPSAQPEIIRCKDCKYLEEDIVFHQDWCRGNRVFVSGDHYCGYAVRRSDERLN